LEAVERPLNWVHGTILGSGVIPDARIRLQTTHSISEAMRNFALPRGTIPFIFLPQDDRIIEFDKHLTKDEKQKVVYVRRTWKTIHYRKTQHIGPPSLDKSISIGACITCATEYVRLEDGTLTGPSEQCEVRLEFDHNLLFEPGANFDLLSKMIIVSTNSLENALKNQIII